MSFPLFVPAFWGQALSRAVKRCASPLLLAAGAGLVCASAPVHAQSRIEGQILVRASALAPDETPETGQLQTADTAVRTTAVLTNQLRTKFPGATLRKNFDNVGWTVVKIPAGMTTDAGLNKMKALLGTDNVMADKRLQITATPNDPQYGSQWWLNKIAAPTAWDIAKGSDSIIVAVIDTGAQLDHPDLKDHLWKNPGEIAGNGKDDDNNGYVDDVYGINVVPGETSASPNDDEGHGTFCAGVIGASTNNGVQVAAVNWNVKVMPLRFLGSDGGGFTSGAIECLNYAIKMKNRGQNVRVTSNSWGPDPDDPSGGATPALKSAFQAAGNAGLLNVVASGNGDANNNAINIDARPQYPASYDDASIISVAASDENDNPTYFSNYGATSVDLAAPGSAILGIDIASSTAYFSGTSMSTPMVAGAAALLLSKEGNFSAAQLKERILGTVDKLPQWSGKTVTGGRLNLTRMLTGASNGLPSISGQVFRNRAGSRVGLAGVKLTLKLGTLTKATVVSGTDGSYSFPNLAAGTYKITPTLAAFKFTVQTVVLGSEAVNRDIEGTSTKPLYAISGVAIGYDNSPREGVQIFQTVGKVTTLLATTDANGAYIIYDRPAGTYRLTAQGANLEWFPTPTAIKLPVKAGTGAPNGIVNFSGLLPDTEAPIITITSPVNNSVVKVNTAPKVAITATDTRSNVAHVYYTLTNTTNGGMVFYNWKTKKWTSNSLETGVTFDKVANAATVKLTVTLPKLPLGTYLFQAWGSDGKGNTTLAGNETTLTITASSTTVAATSVKTS